MTKTPSKVLFSKSPTSSIFSNLWGCDVHISHGNKVATKLYYFHGGKEVLWELHFCVLRVQQPQWASKYTHTTQLITMTCIIFPGLTQPFKFPP